MNKYKQRKNNLYNSLRHGSGQASSKEPFRISLFRMERFLECPRCFYLDRRLGLDRPSLPGWPLNDAVDHLLKNEFDLLRKNGQKHSLMKKYKIEAIPLISKTISPPRWKTQLQ